MYNDERIREKINETQEEGFSRKGAYEGDHADFDLYLYKNDIADMYVIVSSRENGDKISVSEGFNQQELKTLVQAVTDLFWELN